MTLSPTIQSALLRHEAEIHAALRHVVTQANTTDTSSSATDLQAYYGQMQYHLGWVDAHFSATTSNPGKLLRPTLLLLAYEAAGAWSREEAGSPHQETTNSPDHLQRALPAAAAIEL